MGKGTGASQKRIAKWVISIFLNCLNPLVIREREIKTIMWYYHKPTSTAKMKKKMSSTSKDVDQVEHSDTAGCKWYSRVENCPLGSLKPEHML